MYFVTKEELLEEIEKAVDAIFTAVARMFGEEDKKLAKKLKDLESNFLLLINTVGRDKSHQKNNKRRKNMEEEPRAVRGFEEVLDDVIHYILDSGDHELIILIDELEESLKEEGEKKEIWKKKIRQIYKGGMEILKREEDEKKVEEETGN